MSEYKGLTREQVEHRLALAEDVCRMYAWSASTSCGTDREKAAYMLWRDWLDEAWPDSLDRSRYVHLNDDAVERLAAARDEIRERTLRRMRA